MKKKYDPEEMKKRHPFAEEDVAAFKSWLKTDVIPKGYSVIRMPLPPSPQEMKKLRSDLHMSQNEMAHLLNTPKKTYQNWEQGLRHPDGAITLLLNLLRKEPKVAKLLMEI